MNLNINNSNTPSTASAVDERKDMTRDERDELITSVKQTVDALTRIYDGIGEPLTDETTILAMFDQIEGMIDLMELSDPLLRQRDSLVEGVLRRLCRIETIATGDIKRIAGHAKCRLSDVHDYGGPYPLEVAYTGGLVTAARSAALVDAAHSDGGADDRRLLEQMPLRQRSDKSENWGSPNSADLASKRKELGSALDALGDLVRSGPQGWKPVGDVVQAGDIVIGTFRMMCVYKDFLQSVSDYLKALHDSADDPKVRAIASRTRIGFDGIHSIVSESIPKANRVKVKGLAHALWTKLGISEPKKILSVPPWLKPPAHAKGDEPSSAEGE